MLQVNIRGASNYTHFHGKIRKLRLLFVENETCCKIRIQISSIVPRPTCLGDTADPDDICQRAV